MYMYIYPFRVNFEYIRLFFTDLFYQLNEASYSAICNGQISSLLDSDHYQTLIILFSLFSQKSIDD